jgi:hypothetical protein
MLLNRYVYVSTEFALAHHQYHTCTHGKRLTGLLNTTQKKHATEAVPNPAAYLLSYGKREQ